MSNTNTSWNLESFVDALVVELDKTRETLAVKAINKPLSYSVKDMSLELKTFPTFDGEEVHFVTAQPGEGGASTISLQLGSITDRQIRETSKTTSASDIDLDEVGIDEDTKKNLRKIGVTSVNDLEKIEKKNVKLDQHTQKKINYADLANMIQKSRRGQRPPKVKSAALNRTGNGHYELTITGENLSLDPDFQTVGVLNKVPVDVIGKSSSEVKLSATQSHFDQTENEVLLVLDPFSILRFQLTTKDT
ncbi:MAG: hypothetical protein R3C53_00665 [Pirellulaceae bacterium]